MLPTDGKSREFDTLYDYNGVFFSIAAFLRLRSTVVFVAVSVTAYTGSTV